MKQTIIVGKEEYRKKIIELVEKIENPAILIKIHKNDLWICK